MNLCRSPKLNELITKNMKNETLQFLVRNTNIPLASELVEGNPAQTIGISR